MSKVAFLFPGQGSQYAGMAKGLCEAFAEARETFEEANDALGFDLEKLCFEGSMEELTKTENTQPAILTASMAAFRVYMKEVGVEPLFTAGHSLGEFSALCCAGGIRFADAVKIVRQRGRFMQEAVAIGIGGMAAVGGIERNAVEEECRKASERGRTVVVSNYNSPDQIVISGYLDGVEEVSGKLGSMGARVVPLKVSAPFHSPLMQPAAERLKEELGKYNYGELNYPVISNVMALPYPGRESIPDYLARQLVQPVRWQASMEHMQVRGVELAVELGPQTVLRNLMKKNAPGIRAFSYDNASDVQALKKLVAASGQESQGIEGGIAVITRCIAAAVCTKNSNWNEQEYQKGVVEPYRRIKSLKEELEKEGRLPTVEEVKEALEMVKSVFATKGTPMEEQAERFNEIFQETGAAARIPGFRMPA